MDEELYDLTDDPKQRRLARALDRGLVDSVEKIIKQGVDQNGHEWDALLSLCLKMRHDLDIEDYMVKNKKILEILLFAGAQSKKDKFYQKAAFNDLVEKGADEFIEIMLNHGIKPDAESVYHACNQKDFEIFELLMDFNAPLDNYSSLSPLETLAKRVCGKDWSNERPTYLSMISYYDNVPSRIVNKVFRLIDSKHNKNPSQRKKINAELKSLYAKYWSDIIKIANMLIERGQIPTLKAIQFAVDNDYKALRDLYLSYASSDVRLQYESQRSAREKMRAHVMAELATFISVVYRDGELIGYARLLLLGREGESNLSFAQIEVYYPDDSLEVQLTNIPNWKPVRGDLFAMLIGEKYMLWFELVSKINDIGEFSFTKRDGLSGMVR
jgi:hypothetical protein